jgi:hypothetical protein
MGWQGFWFYDSLETQNNVPLASLINYPSTQAFHFDLLNVTVINEWSWRRDFNETYTTPVILAIQSIQPYAYADYLLSSIHQIGWFNRSTYP